MSKRKEMLEHQIQRELSDIIRTEVNDPRLQDILLSVTRVKLSNDLRFAKAFVSAMVDEEKRGTMLDALNFASRYIQAALARRLKIKFVPAISFFYDDSMEIGSKIERILDEIMQRENDSEDSQTDRK